MKKKNEAAEMTTRLVSAYLEDNFEDYESQAMSYLIDKGPGYALVDMSELDTYYETSGALEAITRAFYGFNYNPYLSSDKSPSEPFNPNKEYFAYNGYGNLVSVDENDVTEYLRRHIDMDDFADWLIENDELDEDSFDEWADEHPDAQ